MTHQYNLSKMSLFSMMQHHMTTLCKIKLTLFMWIKVYIVVKCFIIALSTQIRSEIMVSAFGKIHKTVTVIFTLIIQSTDHSLAEQEDQGIFSIMTPMVKVLEIYNHL